MSSDSVVVDFLFIVTSIVGGCNCSMFCCTLLYVHSSIAFILMGKRELVALLNLSSVMVERLFLAVPRGCLQFVIVVFPNHTHFLFLRPGKVQTSLLLRYKEWLEYLKFVYCKPIKVQNKRKFTFFFWLISNVFHRVC